MPCLRSHLADGRTAALAFRVDPGVASTRPHRSDANVERPREDDRRGLDHHVSGGDHLRRWIGHGIDHRLRLQREQQFHAGRSRYRSDRWRTRICRKDELPRNQRLRLALELALDARKARLAHLAGRPCRSHERLMGQPHHATGHCSAGFNCGALSEIPRVRTTWVHGSHHSSERPSATICPIDDEQLLQLRIKGPLRPTPGSPAACSRPPPESSGQRGCSGARSPRFEWR